MKILREFFGEMAFWWLEFCIIAVTMLGIIAILSLLPGRNF